MASTQGPVTKLRPCGWSAGHAAHTDQILCLQAIVTELMKVSPGFKPPPEFRPAKKNRKILVPVQQYPGYNFIGLIIGPRGNTQKRMQQESGAKIALRGKGSVKDGRAGRAGFDPAENEELHVLITADTDESLEKVGIRMRP